MEIWYALGISILFNFVMFLVAFRYKTDKLTDLSYAITFVALAFYGMLSAETLSSYKWVISTMIIVWAVRIGTFLYVRIQKTGKDRRFDDKRDSFVRFGSFWLLQAVTVWTVMLAPLLFLNVGVDPVSGFVFAGVAIWTAGLLTESVADIQKYSFTQNVKNKGKWIASGLWKYSRHPNYFGEILVWFGVYVFVVSGLNGAEQFAAMITPLFITFLLLFVSGVPLLEQAADKKWGKLAAYKNYKSRTSILIPLPPKK